MELKNIYCFSKSGVHVSPVRVRHGKSLLAAYFVLNWISVMF